MSAIVLKKGESAEEKLRLYFGSLGYFVVRSIKAEHQGFTVTDVDLFLYSRPSPISRERTNVDVKMKQRPQALERVFWTKGLKEVLGLEKCIVATTDKRSHVGEFGAKNDVLVLDGNFMAKLDSTNRYSDDRFNEEEFIALIEKANLGQWKKEYEDAKSALLTRFNFDGVNSQLFRMKKIIDEICSGHSGETHYRSLYIHLAFFLITLDYSIKDFSYKDQQERTAIITDGIRFGLMGKSKSDEIIGMSAALVSSFMQKGDCDISAIENEVLSQYLSIPADIIAESLGNTKMMQQLLPLAIKFEGHAFDKSFELPAALSTELQSILGLLCDFYSVDRKKVIK